jgi:hypothetical protein
VNLSFFPSRTSKNRQNRHFISIISTMSTPPPSPVLYRDAVAALHTSSDDPPTPSRQSAAAAVAARLFESTNKRHSSDDRDGTVSGANSPLKKRIDARGSPQRRVINVAGDMDVDSVGFDDLQIDELQPTSGLKPRTRIARISLSPATQLPEVEISPSQPAATSTKPKKKKTATVQRIDTSDSRVFPFIREDVFDTNRFVKTDETVYTSAEMKKYDGDFQKQLNFNFSQRRGVYKKHLNEGRASRSQTIDELDLNSSAFSGESANFQELSRYILEDIIKCRSGQRFLLLLPVKYEPSNDINLRSISASHKQLVDGGEKCKVAGKEYFCFKVTIDHCPSKVKQTNRTKSAFLIITHKVTPID